MQYIQNIAIFMQLNLVLCNEVYILKYFSYVWKTNRKHMAKTKLSAFKY